MVRQFLIDPSESDGCDGALGALCAFGTEFAYGLDVMKEIVHTDYEGRPCPTDNDDCMLCNLEAPVVRSGGEAFKSYYAVEWDYYCCSAVDPARSFAQALIDVIERCGDGNTWPECDVIHTLLWDLGFDCKRLTRVDLVAFWTLFPKGLSEFVSLPYMKLGDFNSPHGNVVRVLNNPYFYKDANAPERRLVEIAEVGGFRFALDRACYIAQPSVLAKELALLNYGCNEPGKVDAVAEGLVTGIAEVLDDWGLAPTRS